MTTTDATVERGSGNVFADLGIPAADAHLLKAELVVRIDAVCDSAASPRPRPGGCPGSLSRTCRRSRGATAASIPWCGCSAS